jgi:anti-anti-sigma regulatory factor
MMMPSRRLTDGSVFTAQVVEIDRTSVVQCRGRLVRSEAAFQLRNSVQSSRDAHRIILDFTELDAIEGGALGMLVFLQQWTEAHGIALTILRPTARVEQKLKEIETSGDCKFEIERESGVMRLVGLADREHWVASTLAA